jgi:hypothetical protein
MLNLLFVLAMIVAAGQPAGGDVAPNTPETELTREKADDTAGAIRVDEDEVVDDLVDDLSGAGEQLLDHADADSAATTAKNKGGDQGLRLAYLIASILFIFGIKGLTHPRTAVRGNMIAAAGMLLALVATLWVGGLSFGWIIAGLVIGAGYGALQGDQGRDDRDAGDGRAV